MREDVRQARVSVEAARDVYGVVPRDDGDVDVVAPGKTREKLRLRRASGAGLSGTRLPPIGSPDPTGARRRDDNLAVLESPEGGTVVASAAARGIGPLAGGAFVAGPARHDSAPAEAGPHIWHDRRSTSTRRLSSGSCSARAA
ncbi:hypothetical protein ACIBP6_19545 [Nonomuraea terrae]|uniref:hypothetical protein n=1 Tax=Nonomuraea terrae TaxID=2530383 RepID=UPI00379B2E10